MAGRQTRPRNLQNITKEVPNEDRERNFTVSTGLDKARVRMVQYDRGISYKILLASYGSFFGIQVSFIIRKVPPSHPLQVAFTLASATAVFALQLHNCSPSAQRWPTWKRGAIVLGQGLATYFPLLAFHLAWMGMTGFLAGSLLLLISGWKAWAPFAAMATMMFVVAIMTWQGPSDIASMAIFCLASGIVVFGLGQLTLLVWHEQARRGEIAELAAIRERTRFARDLHDLLGYSLSAIALKAELSMRIMDTKPDLAREELADVVVFARQAVADVRLVATNYRAMSLAAEAVSTASLLAAAGIMADIEIDCGGLDDKVDTVLATVLREGVTNLLRHSAARTCRVTASQAGESVTLLIANDGTPKSGIDYRDGVGLENLEARLAAIGGTLTVEFQDGTFCLFAAVPHTARRVPGTSGSAPGK
ncbi:MAG TPA: histidine kinase [Trebonia sp.]|nr:histidine kinase [Trebonia sp.]